jgi:hypothetical protein
VVAAASRASSSSSSCTAEPDIPFMNICATKLLGVLGVAKLASVKAKAKFSLGDAISKYLFQAWTDATPPEIREDPNTFFFPAALPAMGYNFDWSEPISDDEVHAVALECAQHNGIVTDAEHAKQFTSKAIRRGIAAEVVSALRDAAGKLNMRHGRAISSTIDAALYAPRTVIVEPGLLHVDLVGIQKDMDDYIQGKLASPAKASLCASCGYPHCKCKKCLALAKGSKSSAPVHNCWLQNRTRGRKSANWIAEDDQQFEARVAAWQKLGVADVPVFKDGNFAFME